VTTETHKIRAHDKRHTDTPEQKFLEKAVVRQLVGLRTAIRSREEITNKKIELSA
jgi:hypothetical protein